MKYIWPVIRNILSIILAIVVWGKLSDAGTEFVTLGGLILILYVSVQEVMINQFNTTTTGAIAIDNEFLRVRKLLHNEQDSDEVEEKEEALKKYKVNKNKVLINSIGLMIIFIIGLLMLFN